MPMVQLFSSNVGARDARGALSGRLGRNLIQRASRAPYRVVHSPLLVRVSQTQADIDIDTATIDEYNRTMCEQMVGT
jgi:hypothetical protein